MAHEVNSNKSEYKFVNNHFMASMKKELSGFTPKIQQIYKLRHNDVEKRFDKLVKLFSSSKGPPIVNRFAFILLLRCYLYFLFRLYIPTSTDTLRQTIEQGQILKVRSKLSIFYCLLMRGFVEHPILPIGTTNT